MNFGWLLLILYIGIHLAVWLDHRRPAVQRLGLPRPCWCRRGHAGGFWSHADVVWHNMNGWRPRRHQGLRMMCGECNPPAGKELACQE